MTIKVSVVGASGRMGALALSLIDAASDLSLHSALDSKSDLSEINGADVVFDVTRLDVSTAVVDAAVSAGIPVVVGTSGWSEGKLSQLAPVVAKVSGTVVVIPNFSIGSMLASKFAAEAAKHFSNIEIVETHHAGKVDSPSGTAIRTAELISKNRKEQPLIVGADQEARGEVVAGVPIHSLRLQGVSAKQEVLLSGSAELLTIAHETSGVNAYAHGVLAAIRFAAKKPVGVHVGLDSVLA